jgi:hypothetical protein
MNQTVPAHVVCCTATAAATFTILVQLNAVTAEAKTQSGTGKFCQT